ncbi:alpha/beta hydrolase [Sphingomonas sp. AOB5]|uniref:alpha/beta fold hydrolase n=1 Tax=Sphingomonas sp. AOB5 TaxID=3034017 RepID=UPI0023F62FE2|nr:alpha/beta hydrolase [Sphingomonas sp. AOB5]MDF7777572.1 alpha/beta hydrolase [Sphingomonas sp. AOB5]
MPDFELQRIALPTGVELDVAIAGDPANPPLIFLHGFPESHRTWRHQIAEFERDHYVVVPDQRGFSGSSKPEGVEAYAPDKTVGDLIALADHLGIGPFTLIGHDWGGAISWMAALQNPGRIARLIIVNAPHPLIFQRTLFDDPAQRAASQYITAFRNPGFDQFIAALTIPGFFGKTFSQHADPALLAPERDTYIAQWSQPGAMTAMLNWYRASTLIVPAPGETPERPAWLDGPFPPVTQPTLVIWGEGDTALLPSQLDGLEAYVPDLTVIRVDAGHFVPWENPQAVNAAMRGWLAPRGG